MDETPKIPGPNLDPLSGAPGARPLGVGVGAAGGGALGAAMGALVGGPPGAVIGAAIGAISGGLTGKGTAEAINPTVEDAYWRENFPSRSYRGSNTYEIYQPAYRYGWEAQRRFPGVSFETVEAELRAGWDDSEHATKLAWGYARHASRDAWRRVEGTTGSQV